MSMMGSGSGSSDNEPSPKKLKYQMSESESESESGSLDNESLPKKAKILDPITDEQAHLEAIEEAALKKIIWDSCEYILELCKKLSYKLYHSLLDGVAMLVYLLYDKDDLYRMHLSRIVYDQRSKFWEELEQEFDPSLKMKKPGYEACKWIVHKKVDQDRYSLLNEYDLATLLAWYASFPDMKPYLIEDYYDYDKEYVKSAIDDDIQEAIRKAKLCPRLPVDQYTSLLIEMVRSDSNEWRDFLLNKAEEKIDQNVVCGLACSSIEDSIGLHIDSSSAHEELVQHIKLHLLRIFIDKTSKVQTEATASVMPYVLLFNVEFLYGPSSHDGFDPSKVAEYRRRVEESNTSLDLADLIEVAELRRKAEGSRFIQRDHLLWAFDERGRGLRTAFEDELASRMAAEDHPPYHIYQTALILAQAEQESLQAKHLAFAVIFSKFFGYSEDEVKEMQADFQSFKTALHMRCVSLPKEGLKTHLWDDF